MSVVFLAGFLAGKSRYEQAVDVQTDETFLSAIDSEKTLYRVNAGGWVYNKHGGMAGRFRKMDSGKWYYETIDLSLRMNTKFTDRYEAERDVFGVLLARGHREPPPSSIPEIVLPRAS